ncbi:MspI family type II restriction endonuclease [Listeria aquatica]|uniref:Type II site-specific deoxyribonuclease n=1 Tax=Listeria aquatica FSL S10-1188 TaxID=1265818 RepID=W7B7F8_9LIST|nr:MspI family type II restriction endonuclease [Listeria aquatica]EUJ21827.1 type II site-specific deoxyribonuclease [Listeria aquatica FSL S10-1188]
MRTKKKIGYEASRKIRSGKRFSSLDNVLTFRELELLIESKISSVDSVGKKTADRGINLEQRLVRIFNSEDNVKRWNKKQDSSIVGDNYDWFLLSLKSFGVNPSENINSMLATKHIPKLPSGGTAKTDVYLQIRTNEQSYQIMISCQKFTR